MQYIHYKNDFSLDLDLTSKTIGSAIDGSLIRYVRFFTRNNGRTYVCCYGNGTLINKGTVVTAICNNSNLEPGILKYTIEFQIPDNIYPDQYKKIEQTYVSEIELVKGNGETEDITVQAMFGATIDGKFNDLEANIDEVSDEVEVISANIVSIQELNSVQDTSINHIEEILENFDPSGSDAIQRLDTSVNALQSDVTSLNSSVNSLQGETDNIATGLTETTNKVNDVSTRVDDVEVILGRKADVSVLGNYYTKDETYNKDEVDRAIADAAMDGSLPAGIVIDNNYVHTDNNYTNEDKAKVRDFDLSLYPTNSSLVENYATKAELQNVDENHPSNSSVSSNYVKKNDMSNYLSDYPSNSSVSSNYAKKSDLNNYPTNSSLSSNYVTKNYADQVYVNSIGLETSQDEQNAYIAQNYLSQTDANENYVSYENIDEIIINTVDNNYTLQHKVIDLINTSTAVKDISTMNTNISNNNTNIQNVSTKLNNDYLTAQVVNRDFVKNASLNDYVLNSSLSTNYTTKDEFNEVWTTFVTADQVDDTYAKIVDVSNHLTTNDISTFKPIVFCTQEEYDDLVENDQVDANTVYMLSGDQTGGDYLTPDDVSNFVTTNDISTFVTNSDLQDELSTYPTWDDISGVYVYADTLDNDVSALGYLKSNDVSNYLQKNTDIEVNSVQFTDNNAVTSYLNIDKANSNNLYILSIGLPDTDAGGELTDREVVAARSIYNGDSEQTELAFGQTSTWAIFGNPNKNTKIQGLNVSIGKTTANVEILGQNVSIGGRNVNDYATTSYVDTQIGNIQNILQTI